MDIKDEHFLRCLFISSDMQKKEKLLLLVYDNLYETRDYLIQTYTAVDKNNYLTFGRSPNK